MITIHRSYLNSNRRPERYEMKYVRQNSRLKHCKVTQLRPGGAAGLVVRKQKPPTQKGIRGGRRGRSLTRRSSGYQPCLVFKSRVQTCVRIQAKSFVFSSVPSDCRDRASKQATTASFLILSNSVFINHAIIPRYI
jgi:hypothetical protein